MTRASFWETEDKGEIQFWMQVDGHAEYAKQNDVVCAACAALSQGLIYALCEEGFHVRYAVDEKAPAIWAICKARDSLEAERVAYMFKTCRRSFEMVAKKVPENVCVSGEKPTMH